MSAELLLTFDDCPSEDPTDLLYRLSKYNMTAVFFCEGEKLERRSSQAKDIIRCGHLLGNHSYSHTSFHKIDEVEQQSEILETDVQIRTLYEELGINRPVSLFRYPYGNSTDIAEEYLQEAGYTAQPFTTQQNFGWGWDIHPNEFCDADLLDPLRQVEGDLHIVLLHDHENKKDDLYTILEHINEHKRMNTVNPYSYI